MHPKKQRASALAAAGLVLAGALGACNNDNLTALNTNPNAPTSAPAGPLFTAAVVGVPGVSTGAGPRMVGNGFDLRQMEFLVQHLAEVQYPDEDRYARIRAPDVQNTFIGPYSSELEDFKNVYRQGQAQKEAGIWAPADVMTQWEFDYITAAWGDIPYSQALAGDSTGGSLTPTYDAQKDVYAGMLSRLTADAQALASATGSLGGADPIYGGNTANWAKFANSLRLRLAIQLVNADQATADAQIKAALADPGGVFASNADNAALAYPGDGVFNNPWSDNFTSRDDHRVSKTLIDVLQGYNDPRLPIYASPTINYQNGKPGAPEYAGQPNGLTAADAGQYFNTASRVGTFIYPAVTPFGSFPGLGTKQKANLLTYAEVSFIEAEAAERGLGGLTPGQAKGFYDAAVGASISQWAAASGTAVASSDVTAYLAQPGVAYVGGTAGLKQIALQKWVALFLDGAQAWFEWRRTCVPALKPGPAAIFSTVPRRLEYPVAEASVNGINLAAAVARQGADNMQTSIYIDKQANAPTCH
ncbi:hypothetical protein tb265_33320 [Gemmatimonadetes bacterium T265]|nr:hypothetical protein tb265_33320 [Gemmatimonadetes bacterium T265]